MRTSGRSGPDRPGHAGTEAADEPASVRTTPDRGARTCPVKALVAKRDRRACSTGSTSSAVRSLSMVPCTSSFETGSNEASIRPSRPTMSSAGERVAAGSRRSSCPISMLPPLARIWAAMSPAGVWFGPKARASLPRERTPWPRRPRPSLVRLRPPSPCHRGCISGLLRGRAVRGLVRADSGAPNHDRGCRNGWALAQNAVWFA
jgi:hypothetical protein